MEQYKIMSACSQFYSMFVTGRQKVYAYSSGLKDFYDLKHVAFFHFVWVISIFGILGISSVCPDILD